MKELLEVITMPVWEFVRETETHLGYLCSTGEIKELRIVSRS